MNFSNTFSYRTHQVAASDIFRKFIQYSFGSFTLQFYFQFSILLWAKAYGLFQHMHMGSLTLIRHNSFQKENNKKATNTFAPRSLIFRLQQEVLKFSDISYI